MIRSRGSLRLLCAALLFVPLAACSRAVAVQSEPGVVYTLEVVNDAPVDMVVSYDAGAGSHLLGTVSANDSQRFVINDPVSTTVHVSAVSEDRSRTVDRTVTLNRTSAVQVRLGP